MRATLNWPICYKFKKHTHTNFHSIYCSSLPIIIYLQLVLQVAEELTMQHIDDYYVQISYIHVI